MLTLSSSQTSGLWACPDPLWGGRRRRGCNNG